VERIGGIEFLVTKHVMGNALQHCRYGPGFEEIQMASSRLLIGGILTVTAWGAGMLQAADEAPAEMVLRYRFQPGQSLRLRRVSNAVMKLDAVPMGFSANVRSEHSLVEKVLDLNGEIATLVTQTEEAKSTGTGFGDEKGGFGSSYKDGKITGYTIFGGKKTPVDGTGEWVANRFAKVDASGERHPYEGKAPSSRDDYWRPSFPAKAVKVGDSWKTQFRWEQAAAPATPGAPPSLASSAMSLEVTLTHTLTGVRKKGGRWVAKIETVGAQREPQSSVGSSTAVIEASTEFDIERGVILSATSHSESDNKIGSEAPASDAGQPALGLTGTMRSVERVSVQFVETKSKR